MNRKESSDYVCRKCFEQNPSGISLLKNVCNGNHSVSEQKVRVVWSGAEKRLVMVGGDSPIAIRPKPKAILPKRRSNRLFILCDGERCIGESCSYAHSYEELSAWNEKLTSTRAEPLRHTSTESHVSTLQDMDVQADNSSVPHRDSMSCDNVSEWESFAEHAASNKSDDIMDNSRSIMWQSVSTEDVGLTTGTYRQYHQKLLKQDKKRHINWLRKKCNGTYDLILLKEKPKWITKPKPKHVSYACIAGLTSAQILFATHDSQPETVCALFQIRKRRIFVDIVKHTLCNDEDCLYVAMDGTNQEKIKKAAVEMSVTMNASSSQTADIVIPKIRVTFNTKQYYFTCCQESIDHISDDIIERIIPEVDRFVHLQTCVLTEEDKKVLKLKQCSDDQAEALKKIIALPPASPPLLITGAFGTGKTHALILAANYILQAPGREDTKVLVCCQSSTSADHFLDHYSSTHIRHQNAIVRLTSFENPKMKPSYQTAPQFISKLRLTTKKILVICTFHDSLMLARELKKQQQSLSFAYILMDEGAQAREAEAVAPFFMADESTRIVIAGDCQQVHPVVMVNGPNPNCISLLERLITSYDNIGDAAKAYLICLSEAGYRCHPDIVHFCRELFYEPTTTLQFASSTSEADFPLHFVCSSIQQEVYTDDLNGREKVARVVVEQVFSINDRWSVKEWGPKDLTQACVLSCNKKEFNTFRDILHKEKFKEVEKKIKCLTTSNIQGHEFRAVLLNTFEPTWDNGTPLTESRSIVNPYVFNTVLSRAQSLVIAIGNPFMLLMMEEHTVRKYGERWRCWSHYLRVCLEHDTLTFDPSLQLEPEACRQWKEKLTAHLKESHSKVYESDIMSHTSEDIGDILVDTILNDEALNLPSSNKALEKHISRLEMDYDVVAELGRGGYGLVYHVKHKLDHKEYAVKVIKLPSDHQGQENVLKEVQCLSTLSHNNIVRYNSSWKEDAPIESTNSMWKALQELNAESYSCADKSSYGITFTVEEHKDDSTSSEVYISPGKGGEKVPVGTPSSNESSDVATFDSDASIPITPPSAKKDGLSALFIQTELCSITLKQWLVNTTDDRNRKTVVQFFDQMLNAVKYIHEKKLIHRDLKPANIFLAENDVLKVGDFGLVTGGELQTQESRDKKTDHSHTIGAGTKLYMSPEQKSNSKYNEKVDIYALGLIFFEMNCPTGSDQERDNIFGDLKQHKKFPASFGQSKLPRERTIIELMISDNPEKRPSAEDISSGDCLKRLKKFVGSLNGNAAHILKL